MSDVKDISAWFRTPASSTDWLVELHVPRGVRGQACSWYGSTGVTWCDGSVTLPQHELVARNGSSAGAGENLTHVLHQTEAVLCVQPEAVWQLPLLDTGRALSYSFNSWLWDIFGWTKNLDECQWRAELTRWLFPDDERFSPPLRRLMVENLPGRPSRRQGPTLHQWSSGGAAAGSSTPSASDGGHCSTASDWKKKQKHAAFTRCHPVWFDHCYSWTDTHIMACCRGDRSVCTAWWVSTVHAAAQTCPFQLYGSL